MKSWLVVLILIPLISFAEEKRKVDQNAYGDWFSNFIAQLKGDKNSENAKKSKETKVSMAMRDQKTMEIAQNTLEFSEINKALSIEVNDINSRNKELKENIDKINQKIEKEKNYLKNSFEISDAEKSIPTDKLSIPAAKDSALRLSSAKKELTDIQIEIGKNQEILEKNAEKTRKAKEDHERKQNQLNKDLDGTNDTIIKSAINDHLAQLDSRIKLSGAFSDISILNVKVLNAREKIGQLEKTIDNTVSGLYLRGKITKLLESELFCSAQRKCDINHQGNPINKSDLNKIFSSSDEIVNLEKSADELKNK